MKSRAEYLHEDSYEFIQDCKSIYQRSSKAAISKSINACCDSTLLQEKASQLRSEMNKACKTTARMLKELSSTRDETINLIEDVVFPREKMAMLKAISIVHKCESVALCLDGEHELPEPLKRSIREDLSVARDMYKELEAEPEWAEKSSIAKLWSSFVGLSCLKYISDQPIM